MQHRTLAFLFAVVGLAAAPSVGATLDETVTNLKVRTTLLERFGTDALGIKIDVNGTSVVLSGAVDKKETRDGARPAALAVKGVSRVENRISVGNGPATKTKEAANRARANWENSVLEARIKGRLFEQVGENALKITVHAVGGVVTLSGSVPTASIRATAVDTATKTKGVARLVDELKVG